MNQLTLAIRQHAAQLLRDDIIDVVIGFRKGSLALRAQPAFITEFEQADELVLDGFCQSNLASYITRRSDEERIGIICRGCESRAVRVLVSEHQRRRDSLYVVGVPCEGIIDPRKIERLGGLGPEGSANVLQAVDEGDEVVITVREGEQRFSRLDVLHDSCARCASPDLVGTDVILGGALSEDGRGNRWAAVVEFEALPADERYAYFARESEQCIRCYACREACPMCYCTQCFVDYTAPRWTESMVTPSGTQGWHVVRAFHQTGRCVSCGACERACPMGIKMTYLTDKLNYDMSQQYGFEVGASDEAKPPFAAFSLDDKERFVR